MTEPIVPEVVKAVKDHADNALASMTTAMTALGGGAYAMFKKFSLNPLKSRVHRIEEEVREMPSKTDFKEAFTELKTFVNDRHTQLHGDMIEMRQRLDAHIDAADRRSK